MRTLKIWIGLMGALLLASCTQREKSDTESDLVQINIDLSDRAEVYDIGNDIEPEWEICALETKDDNLIGIIHRIHSKNDLYYILDTQSSAISVFNRKGEYVSRLDKKGLGPDDYLQLDACSVVGKNTWVAAGLDLICYDENWHVIERQRLTMLPVWDMTAMDGCIYLASNWSGTDCQLVEYDPASRQQNCLMRLPKYDPRQLRKINKQTQLALSEEGGLFIHNFCDTIFRISDHRVIPQYRFRFSERYEDVPLSMESITKPTDRIRGLAAIFRTPNSIILPYVDREVLQYAVYNERKGAGQVYTKFGYADLGNLTSSGSCHFTCDGEMIWVYEPENLLAGINESKIKNEADRQKIHAVLSNIKKEDNPILFRFKLKKDAGL